MSENEFVLFALVIAWLASTGVLLWIYYRLMQIADRKQFNNCAHRRNATPLAQIRRKQ